MCQHCETEITEEVLAYLVQHPRAQDTIEGIVEWWLLEQRIKHQTVNVRQALARLTEAGLVIERRGQGARSVYRINRRKLKTIKATLAKRAGRWPKT